MPMSSTTESETARGSRIDGHCADFIGPRMTTRHAAADHDTTVTRPRRGWGLIVNLLLQAGHLSSAQIRHTTSVQAKLFTPRTLLEVLQQLGTTETATIAAANPDAVELAPLLVRLGTCRRASVPRTDYRAH
jgi:hypothetical protein